MPKKVTEPVNEPAIELDYSPDEVREKIRSIYPDKPYGYTNITLKRAIPGGEWQMLKKYNDLPEWDQIQQEFGGGKYKLWIQYKAEGDPWSERKLEVIDLNIAGPSKEIVLESSANVTAAAQPVDPEDAEMKFLLKLKAYKEILGMGSSAGTGDSSAITVEFMKAMADLQAKFMEVQKPAENTLVTQFMTEAMKAGLTKSNIDPLDGYLKVHGIINKFNPAGAPAGEESVTDTISKWMPIVEKGLPILTGMLNKQPAGVPVAGSNPVLLPSGSTSGAPGAAPAGEGGVMAAINTLASIMDRNFAHVTAELAATKKKLAELELTDEPEPAENKNENLTTAAAEEEAQNMNWGKLIAALPDDAKINQLKEYLGKNTVEEVFRWCITYKAIPDLDEFNRILQLAGHEIYKPADELLRELGLLPPIIENTNNAPDA